MASLAPSKVGTSHPQAVTRHLCRFLARDVDTALLLPGSDGRATVEAFIAERFYREHGARIHTYLSALLSLSRERGYLAALGLGPAAGRQLFLEQYLEQSAEQIVAGHCRTPVARSQIVEIGNLVSIHSGATALLYLMLLAVVERAGYDWVVFTATPEVRRGIAKIGLRIAPVCRADPARLTGETGDWGRYYDAEPWVMIGFIGESMSVCRSNPELRAGLELQAQQIGAIAALLASL